MMPHLPAALAVLLTASSLAPAQSHGADAGRFEKGAIMTLRMEPLWGPACDLTVHVDVWPSNTGAKSVGLVCGGRKTHRQLTPREVTGFLRLAKEADLYRARGIGRDGRGGDAWLATLKVTDAGLIVVLVVSGNPEFADGPRAQLLTFLQKLYVELRPLLLSGKR